MGEHRCRGASEGMMARFGVRVLPPEATNTGGTTPTAGRADPVTRQEAKAADAAAREETTAARRWCVPPSLHHFLVHLLGSRECKASIARELLQ